MTTEMVATTAYELDAKIHAANINVRANFLVMAKLLVQMREERLYKALDYPSFESYLGSLGAEGNRAWLYKLIRAWEVFSKKMEVPDKTLIEIGPSKLDVIAPLAPAMMLEEHHKAAWLTKAIVLSKSDLINEVRECQGKPLLSSPAPTGHINPGLSDLLHFKSYITYVESCSCILCGDIPIEKAHFPRTQKRGGEDWQVIPLCNKCHVELHTTGVDTFTANYKNSIFGYFYGLVLRIWEGQKK